MPSFRDRLLKGLPIWRDILRRTKPLVMSTIIAGGAAGLHTVSAIKKGDQLVSVIYLHYTTGTNDRSSEMIGQGGKKGAGVLIMNDGQIDDTGGTASTGGFLLATWLTWEDR